MFRTASNSPCHFLVYTNDLNWHLRPRTVDDPYLAIESQDVKHGTASFQVAIQRSTTSNVDELCKSPDLTGQSNDGPVRQRTVDVGHNAVPAIEREYVDNGTKRLQIVFCVSLKAGVFQILLISQAPENVFDWWRPRFEQLVHSLRLAA